jgi:tetratricopeptide (TPR) repeat protein
MTAPPQPAPAPGAKDDDIPAATPGQEMGLSDSTLHWLEDGDQAVPGRVTEPGTMPSYDPRAPVAGRRRAVLVTGGAALIALVIAGAFYMQAEQRKAAQAPAPVVVEPARDLTNRAEFALARKRYDEALELAHLALVADQRFADAHFVVATCEQARHQPAAARDAYRKYLELAPLGTHAEAARAALATLPP